MVPPESAGRSPFPLLTGGSLLLPGFGSVAASDAVRTEAEHRILQRHGGRIRAEGAPGKGATFYFSLPLAEDGKNGADAVRVMRAPV